MDLLSEWDGPDAPVEVMRAAGARAAEGAGQSAAAQVLVRLGAEVAVTVSDGRTVLSTNGCPVAGGVLERPELCRWVSALLSGACGQSIEESCDRSGGRPRCRFTLDPAASSGS